MTGNIVPTNANCVTSLEVKGITSAERLKKFMSTHDRPLSMGAMNVLARRMEITDHEGIIAIVGEDRRPPTMN